MIPAKLTPHFIESQVEFHASGAEFYATHGQQQMAEWSKSQAAYWRDKLTPVASGDDTEDRWE